jgi:hypothetical protein
MHVFKATIPSVIPTRETLTPSSRSCEARKFKITYPLKKVRERDAEKSVS